MHDPGGSRPLLRLRRGLALSFIVAALFVACGDSSADGEDGPEAPTGECERASDWECLDGVQGYCQSACDGNANKGFLFCSGSACYCGRGDSSTIQCDGSFDVNGCGACQAATDAGCCGLRYPDADPGEGGGAPTPTTILEKCVVSCEEQFACFDEHPPWTCEDMCGEQVGFVNSDECASIEATCGSISYEQMLDCMLAAGDPCAAGPFYACANSLPDCACGFEFFGPGCGRPSGQ
jgi:hypothetical protein